MKNIYLTRNNSHATMLTNKKEWTLLWEVYYYLLYNEYNKYHSHTDSYTPTYECLHNYNDSFIENINNYIIMSKNKKTSYCGDHNGTFIPN